MDNIQGIIQGSRVADAAAAGSIGAAAAVNLSQLNLYVQIAAGLVAIAAGICASVFHIIKTIELREHNKLERLERRMATLKGELTEAVMEAQDRMLEDN